MFLNVSAATSCLETLVFIDLCNILEDVELNHPMDGHLFQVLLFSNWLVGYV